MRWGGGCEKALGFDHHATERGVEKLHRHVPYELFGGRPKLHYTANKLLAIIQGWAMNEFVAQATGYRGMG